MKKTGWMIAICVMGASLAVAQMLLPGDGVSIVEKPRLVEDTVSTNAPVVADTNALASMAAEEKVLLAEAKAITIEITEISYPLRNYRERIVAQDKELQTLTKAIYEKQMELEAKLAEKYPDIGAKTRHRDELTRKYSEVSTKLRALRKKMDQIQDVMRKNQSGNKTAK